MSMWLSFAVVAFNAWFASVNAQSTPADGFPNNKCLRLDDFEIDGDWWAREAGAVDWSSVLQGTRTTMSNSEWRTTQNQCTNDFSRWGYYYDAGIFCDTYDLNEQSQLQNNNKHTNDCCPQQWIPLLTTPMQDKGDLTNAYYVGSDVDLILCAAFERIDVNGASYMDMEFNQQITQEYARANNESLECNWMNGTLWKCYYPDRQAGDLQISFEIANAITDNVIVISEWNPASTSFETIRIEDMSGWTGVQTKYISADGAFRAAVNNVTTEASSFGYVCDDKDIAADCPMIDKVGAFFEACIDFKKLDPPFTSLSFQGLVIKARASAKGAYKDTSGAIYHIIDSSRNRYPWADSECAPTAAPTAPTIAVPTMSPTTGTPTADTTSPTSGPTQSPTGATSQPSQAPTSVTQTPTGATGAPSVSPTSTTVVPTHQPTTSPSDVTDQPTVIPTGSPSNVPTSVTSNPTTSRPTASPVTTDPTQSPSTIPTESPTRVPTTDPTEYPTEKPTEDDGQGDNDNQGDQGGGKTFADQWNEAFGGGGAADDEDACTDGFAACYPGVLAVLVVAGVAFVAYWVVGALWLKYRQGNRPHGVDTGPSYQANDTEMGRANSQASKWKSDWELEQERKASQAAGDNAADAADED